MSTSPLRSNTDLVGGIIEAVKERIKTEKLPPAKRSGRYEVLDFVRGITIISMVLYHFVWDLVYIAGLDWQWYQSKFAHVWQMSICCTFILLAGFCCALSRHKLKRGAAVFLSGALVTIVTLVFMPQERIIFGVLTMLGTSMLLMIPLERVLSRADSRIGIAVSLVLFLLTYDVSRGYIGLCGIHLLNIPDCLYRLGYIGTFLGFMESDFYSTDYFPLMPWFFLFVCGFFLFKLFEKYGIFKTKVFNRDFRNPITVIGRHSLLIYMLHQPVLYLIVRVVVHFTAIV